MLAMFDEKHRKALVQSVNHRQLKYNPPKAITQRTNKFENVKVQNLVTTLKDLNLTD
jgi:hypothetical protein